MKKLLIILFILHGFFLAAEVVVELQDDIGDDYGDGNVTYPEHAMFTDGLFDIENFRIEDAGNYYRFIIRIRGKVDFVEYDEFKYKYGIPDDFIFPLVQIYIDTDHQMNSGLTETIFGTNVTISPASAWERAVIFSAMPENFKASIKRNQEVLLPRITVPDKMKISSDKRELSVRVSKNYLGQIQPEWGFAVMMFCHDVTTTVKKNNYTMEIKSSASLFNFGGGHGTLYFRYNPNVIDLITPSFRSQKKILHDYDVENKTYAIIDAVYPFDSKLRSAETVGVVKQVSEEKVVVNLGTDQGVVKGTKLIIENKYIVEVQDVFPELCIANFTGEDDIYDIKEGMQVRIWQE